MYLVYVRECMESTWIESEVETRASIVGAFSSFEKAKEAIISYYNNENDGSFTKLIEWKNEANDYCGASWREEDEDYNVDVEACIVPCKIDDLLEDEVWSTDSEGNSIKNKHIGRFIV